jgi:hypothetical protein
MCRRIPVLCLVSTAGVEHAVGAVEHSRVVNVRLSAIMDAGSASVYVRTGEAGIVSVGRG